MSDIRYSPERPQGVNLLTFYLLSIRFRYVTSVRSERHEHPKVEIELFNYLLVEVEDP